MVSHIEPQKGLVGSSSTLSYVSPPRLQKCGWSQRQIAEAVRRVRRDKHSRMVNGHNQNFDHVNENLEKVASGIKKIFAFRKSEYERQLEDSLTKIPQEVAPPQRSYALSA